MILLDLTVVTLYLIFFKNLFWCCRIYWNTLQPRFDLTANQLPDLRTTEGYIMQAFVGTKINIIQQSWPLVSSVVDQNLFITDPRPDMVFLKVLDSGLFKHT